MRIPTFLRPLAAIPLAVGLSTCATNPATGGRMLSFISESQEIAMGREADASIVAQMGLVEDTAIQRYVSNIGLGLAKSSERPNLPWTFRVVDDPIINAFALPGGFIYVSRGILAHFNSEAELASVLGHEIGHVTARHSVQQMSKQQLTQIGLGVASVAAPKLGQFLGIASQGLELLFLKFSRDDENQADALGLRYMRRGTYDPRQMPQVYVMLERVSAAAGGGRIPDWQSTHPNPADRQQRLTTAVAAIPLDSLGTVVRRDEYLQRIDGIVYGHNPREGFFRDARFYHPDLKLQMTFPPGWRTMNTRQAVGGQSQQGDAQLVLTATRGATPDSVARAFFEQVQGQPQRRQINGLAAITGTFTAQNQQGQQLAGAAAFIAYGGLIYETVGLATPQGWQTHQSAVTAAIQSFGPLTDAAVLNVQPNRLDVVRLDRDVNVREFAQRYTGPVPFAELAVLNNVDSTSTLPRGSIAKRIVGNFTN
jgi:predicted Zn-dependent protease